MPATEQAWRDQKRMHLIFAVTGVVLLLSTIWMFAADHDREWKNYQKTSRQIELVKNSWDQFQALNNEYLDTLHLLNDKIRELRSLQFEDSEEALLNEFWLVAGMQVDSTEATTEAASSSTDDPSKTDYPTKPFSGSPDESVQSLYEDYESARAALKQATDNAKSERDGSSSKDGYIRLQEAVDTLQNELTSNQATLETAQKTLAAAEANLARAEDKTQAEEAKEKAAGDVDAAAEAIATTEERLRAAKVVASDAKQDLHAAEEAVLPYRTGVLDVLRKVIRKARDQEEIALQKRKFASAYFDAARANVGLGVRDGVTKEEAIQRQQITEEKQAEVDQLLTDYEAKSEHRKTLAKILKQLTSSESDLAKQATNNRSALQQLEAGSIAVRSTYFTGGFPYFGKKWLELPILDAFGSPLKIDNLWSDGLTHKYGSFSYVRRFDRCTTCHQAIQKTATGSATKPAYESQRQIELTLLPPAQEDVAALSEELLSADKSLRGETIAEKRLEHLLGIRIANEGLEKRNDTTVMLVRSHSLAAQARVRLSEDKRQPVGSSAIRESLLGPESTAGIGPISEAAGLRVGDIIAAINGDPMKSPERARFRLLEAAQSGDTLILTIKRGLPHPYASHPRLDLFIGSLSPHKLSDFACTVCHEGQGSATAFQWASHAPNTERQRKDWQRDLGWFDNHHWILPMHPQRFLESSCLKCHHDVISLFPSEKFPEPPAPKLTRGYNLLRKYGCYGCHEINGFDGPDRRIGPDLRLEPNFFAAAQQLKFKPGTGFEKLDVEEQQQIDELIEHPELNNVRHAIRAMIKADSESAEPRLSKYVHTKIQPLLKDVESPGKESRPGPSLRFVGNKVSPKFLFDWIRSPGHFRPDSRMPQFFGLWNHLDSGAIQAEIDILSNQKTMSADTGDAETDIARIDKQLAELKQRLAKHHESQFEPLEVFGTATYLLDSTQRFDFVEPAEVTASLPSEMVARGKVLFEERGCLACHNHQDFPEATKMRPADAIVQGPDLSGIAEKFAANRNPSGKRWLYSWIREPSRYHARTVMPDLILDPLEHRDLQGNVTMTTDPIADIVEYLLSASTSDWEPAEGTIFSEEQVNDDALNALVLEHLKDAFYVATAEKYRDQGIPREIRGELKSAELELVVDEGETLTKKHKLRYVGVKTIAKYGCFGCHDIPGFEDAKPIGTGLADWGRKDPGKLAFEHVTHHLHADHGHHTKPAPKHVEETVSDTEQETLAYYRHQIEHGSRIGFIFQKLREPRSYDYHVTKNKKYNERLRMPQFPFNNDEREAIIAFVLGLVAEPPTDKYVFHPDPQTAAIIAGRKVFEKFNCGGCHILDSEKWDISFPAGHFEEPNSKATFPFLASSVSPETLSTSTEQGRNSRLSATLYGMPALADGDGLPIAYDEDEDPLEEADEEDAFDPFSVQYDFDLWQPAVIEGSVFEPDQVLRNIPATWVNERTAAAGGFLAKYLVKHVVQRAKDGEPLLSRTANPNAKGAEAWSWLPPPLIGEGNKVQSDWLHSFLLDPYRIRPLTVLRMPKFNMSADEATKLVNFFAARDKAKHPYLYNPRTRKAHLEKAESEYRSLLLSIDTDASESRFDHALRILTDKKSGCVQCHELGDFSSSPKGPNLSKVHRRLRPDYLRRWIAKPASILPYTSMQQNFKYSPETPAQDGFVIKDAAGEDMKYVHGTSTQQLDAVVDLLMNYDDYMKQRVSMSRLIEATNPPASVEPDTPVEDTEADVAN